MAGIIESDDEGAAHNGDAAHAAPIGVDVFGGSIRFYADEDRFVAFCGCPTHRTTGGNACRMQRACRASGVPGKEYVGRPLGTMLAWLKCGCDNSVADWAEHMNIFLLPTFSHVERSRLRRELEAMPGGPTLLGQERRLRPGEPPEPIVVSWPT